MNRNDFAKNAQKCHTEIYLDETISVYKLRDEFLRKDIFAYTLEDETSFRNGLFVGFYRSQGICLSAIKRRLQADAKWDEAKRLEVEIARVEKQLQELKEKLQKLGG